MQYKSNSSYLRIFTWLGLALLVTLPAHAMVLWDESIGGDLSNNQAAPNAFTLSPGVNSVIGNVNGSTGDSQDWIALTVPAGMQLQSDVLAAYSSTDAQGFTGFQVGSSFVGSAFVAGSYAGYAHYGTGATNPTTPASVVGMDLFPIMDNSTAAAGSTGFTPPLGPGTYTFLIQQLGASTNYQFNFTAATATVPEPATFVLPALVTGLLFFRRCRRSI